MGAFLLGVGCQRSGSTWLYDRLCDHPQADFGPTKELHVLDALFVPEMKRWYDRVFVDVLHHARAPHDVPLRRGHATVAASLLDLGQYFDHFHYRLLRSPGVRLVGDLTPAYAGLPVAALELVRDAFAHRGVELKVLFVLRDPVERCWSQVRLVRRDNPAHKLPACEADHLRARYTTPACTMRTRYDHTLARLEAVFPAEALHVALYEQLHTEAGIERLCAFLGIDPFVGGLAERVHASPKGASIPDALREEIAAFYRPVYEDARRRFGAEVIRACWPSDGLVAPALA